MAEPLNIREVRFYKQWNISRFLKVVRRYSGKAAPHEKLGYSKALGAPCLASSGLLSCCLFLLFLVSTIRRPVNSAGSWDVCAHRNCSCFWRSFICHSCISVCAIYRHKQACYLTDRTHWQRLSYCCKERHSQCRCQCWVDRQALWQWNCPSIHSFWHWSSLRDSC